jgi:hypothetical protein
MLAHALLERLARRPPPPPPWSAAGAGLGALAIAAAAAGAGAVAAAVMVGRDPLLATAVFLLSVQVATALAVWAAARRHTASVATALGFVAPPRPLATFLAAMAGMLAVLVPYNLAIWSVAREAMLADLKPFAGMIHSPYGWLFAIVVGIGAPISEELLFRGFLLPAIARSRLGWIGAALLTTAIWTCLHLGYSLWGLAEVFAIGLYLSWLVWWSGSLWIPIACHMTYNLSLLTLLMVVVWPA